MNPAAFGGFFPSLSKDILWEVGTVSRVRCAAPKARALDTVPTSHQILLRRKRREGVAIGQPLALARGAAARRVPNSNLDSRRVTLLRAQNGLDKGVHRSHPAGQNGRRLCAT